MINYKIERQNFEIILQQIGAILLLEFQNQVWEFYNTECDGVGIFLERSAPINQVEMSIITISSSRGSYDNRHAGYVDGTYTYNIDVFTNSKSIGNEAGDKLAAIKNHRLAGIVRAILEDPIYKTLGFQPGSIGNLRVNSVEFGEIRNGEKDSVNTSVGHLVVELKAEETSRLIVGKPLLSALTQIKLNETEFGLQYKYGFPTVTLTAISFDFPDTGISSFSAAKIWQASAEFLTEDLIITAPNGFIINQDGSDTDAGPITFVPVDGVVEETIIYCKFNPEDEQEYSGNISHVSSGVTKNISVSGLGVNLYIVALGGQITRDGDYLIHTFTYPGDQFNVLSNLDNSVLDYLLVAGGGAGGATSNGGAGGGGAGGMLIGSYTPSDGNFPIIVGVGGTGQGPQVDTPGLSGGNSTAFGLTAIGGGGGGSGLGGPDTGLFGLSGGSAGGNGIRAQTRTGFPTAGQGNTGGICLPGGQSDAGAGAGGKVSAGANPVNGSNAGGAGGAGQSSSISGTLQFYAGGGAGGSFLSNSFGLGGSGVGGNGGHGSGSSNYIAATDGAANTGSGGGAAGLAAGGENNAGGSGANGICIIRYFYPLPAEVPEMNVMLTSQ